MQLLPQRSLFALLFLTAALQTAPGAPPRYSMKLIPPPEKLEYAAPFRMTERGEVVGYAAPEPYHPLAAAMFIDAEGRASVLPAEDDSFNFAFGIAGNGRIVGQSGRRACVWEGGSQRFLDVPPGVFSGLAAGANASGLICGNFGDSDEIGPQHCVWMDVGRPPLPLKGLLEGNTIGTAWAVNEAGQIAGSSGGIQGGFLAARWDSPDASPLRIGPLEGAFNSEARGINEHGDVIGRSSFESGAIQAFIYLGRENDLSGLPFLKDGQGYSEAFDINDSRQVVGTARAAGRVHAVLWHGGMAHDLNDLTVSKDPKVRYLSSAGSINESGQIAAEAVVAEGDLDLPRWIAILSPLFIRGDSNGDGVVDIADPVATLGFLFLGEPAPGCLEAANSNDEGEVDISDAVHTLLYLFSGGAVIPPPFPNEGHDPTPGGTSCISR